MKYKYMFCFMVFLGFCGLADAYEGAEGYWDNVVLGRVIISYDNSIDVHKASLEELGIADKGADVVTKSVGPLNFVIVQTAEDIEEMKKFIELMEKHPNVKYANPNIWMKIAFTPNDTYYSLYQYDKRQMNCEAAWEYTLGDTCISVAIVDWGTQYTHPDLAAHYETCKGYDYYGMDNDPKPESSSEFHATHCSGIAAAVINNTTGIAGVANVRLYSYRCGDPSLGIDVGAVIQSIQDAASLGVNVISMSFGGYSTIPQLDDAISYAWNRGCLLCAGAGNDGSSNDYYPAGHSKVIAVGAIDSSDQHWSDITGESNYGPNQELVAGGVNIMSTVPFNQYKKLNGTSMACPNVAGGAALVWSANPNLTNQEVRAALCSTAVDLGAPGRDDYYGYGKPDLCEAIKLVSIEESEKLKVKSEKLEVSPNPVVGKVVIRYSLNENRTIHDLRLTIHDIAGREIETLVNEQKKAGNYTLSIDMRNFSSGIYFVTLRTSDTRASKKIILME